MIAACARVGANAPKGGEAGSFAGAMPGGRVDEVKDMRSILLWAMSEVPFQVGEHKRTP